MSPHQDERSDGPERRLAELRARLLEISSRPVHRYEDLDETDRIESELFPLEREISLSRGLETAIRLDWEAAWDGSSDPVVLIAKLRTFLIYSYPDRTSPGASRSRLNAVVEFVRCYDTRFGGPNDEVYYGQPLYGRGLEYGRAHLIRNSEWVREVVKINSVHDCFDPSTWDRLKHFLFLFHDNRFECLAEDALVSKHTEPLDQLVARAAERLGMRRGAHGST